MKKTEVITYNLHNRGRTYRGQDRSNVDFSRVIAYINGPVCDEKVKNRDLLGFYGHFTRQKYGLEPREVGANKKYETFLVPAIVTTKLKAYKDGTIEHQAEFLETEPGQICAKLYNSHVGGFSSVINGTRDAFLGFDYVLEPNYTTNRGYLLDSVNSLDMTAAEMDSVMAYEQRAALLELLDRTENAYKIATESLDRLQVENNQLYSLLAQKGISPDSPILDDVQGKLPIVTSSRARAEFFDDVERFRNASLPKIIEPRKTEQEVSPDQRLFNRILGRS